VRVLEAAGHEVIVAASGKAALEALACGRPDLILLDIGLPDMDGFELMDRARGLSGARVLVVDDEDATRRCTARALRSAGADVRETADRAAPSSDDTGQLGESLDRALETLWMAFQPIVRRDGTLFGYEALMRTREAALPHPGAVLDAAERLGRVAEIGRRTRRAAASFVDAADPGASIFLNLHAADLADPDLRREDGSIASAAKRFVLEVTERASLDQVENPSAVVAVLRERGFRIAVDDLGAGYAGMSSFTLLSPDVAKLDMSLVRNVDTDERREKVIKGLTGLCHDLGVVVVAEGVETVGERDKLLSLGCDLFQGYLIARPAEPFPAVRWPEHGFGRQLGLGLGWNGGG
jgi:EAL domain-containing protein (putative c-di-GMP-specific phosphodiesterase class I)